MQNNFTNLEALKTYIHNKKAGSILITYRNCKDYEGMVLGIGIIFDTQEVKYELDLEWISFGLDLYAENLLENYLYQFKNIEELMEYLLVKYSIKITDIPLKYSTDQSQFPNPIKDKAKTPLFEKAWQQFQHDFETKVFLDKSLKLVYSTHDL